MDALGKLSRMSVLMNPDNPVSTVFMEETQTAAREVGIELQRLEARNAEEIDRAFDAASRGRTGALIVFDDPTIWSHRKQIVAVVAARAIPAMYGYTDFVVDGGLMSYGPNRPDQYRRTAGYIDKILKGARAADLPVEQPTKFELVINLTTAKALGLELPPALLARADEVIE